ncbi:hypothetical protein QO005_000309 [Rhizobium paknamense]|uniref:Uncharacterized protein n=1 Tax=Rhizobium paknamense TaxID=1206817 RepID=A0ABU0I6Z2_9HYPH|nr:hypothetical protein [Rhizobium paknamense]
MRGILNPSNEGGFYLKKPVDNIPARAPRQRRQRRTTVIRMSVSGRQRHNPVATAVLGLIKRPVSLTQQMLG